MAQYIQRKSTPAAQKLGDPPDFSVYRVARSIVFSVMFCRELFVLFRLPIVLFVRRLTDYHPCRIFRLFSQISLPWCFLVAEPSTLKMCS